jgi:hypothetical protein
MVSGNYLVSSIYAVVRPVHLRHPSILVMGWNSESVVLASAALV